jgi:isocitrate/isopropylmalate dehydrogenase
MAKSCFKQSFLLVSVPVNSRQIDPRPDLRPFVVGILKGEGSGPELIGAACRVLNAVAESCGLDFCIRTGGDTGSLSAERTGQFLTDEVAEFCGEVFASGGAIMAGPAGGRFVYDMRVGSSLTTNPLRSYPELRDVCRIKLPAKPLDILVVRENLQDLYQGNSAEASSEDGLKFFILLFKGKQVRAVLKLQAAARKRQMVRGDQQKFRSPAIHSLTHMR